MRDYTEKLISLIYPKRCPVCGEIMGNDQEDIHPKCSDRLMLCGDDVCAKCGKPLFAAPHTHARSDSVSSNSAEEYANRDSVSLSSAEEYAKNISMLVKEPLCEECMERKRYFDEGRSLYVRNEYSRNMIYRFKYHSSRQIGRYLGKEMARNFHGLIKQWNPDMIIAVPLHKSRLASRGFNQSMDLALEVQEKLFYDHGLLIPISDDLIIRDRKTSRQKDLSASQRRRNMNNAFAINGNMNISGKRILVIDDVYTTGSTIDEIARLLKAGGAREVYFLAVTASDVI